MRRTYFTRAALRCLIKGGEFDAFVGLLNPSMRTPGGVVRDGRSRKCPGRTDPPETATRRCGCCTLVLHVSGLGAKEPTGCLGLRGN